MTPSEAEAQFQALVSYAANTMQGLSTIGADPGLVLAAYAHVAVENAVRMQGETKTRAMVELAIEAGRPTTIIRPEYSK